MRKVTGILYHPSLHKARPDVVIVPGPNRTVCIAGPKYLLDGFVPPLENSGLLLHRPAPATLLVVY
jgi:hypothetical protein